MAISLIKEYGRTQSQKREFICDTAEDLAAIPYPQLGMSAYVVNSAESYIYSDGWMIKQGANSDDKGVAMPSEDDALKLVAEMGLVEPMAAEDGAVYTDEAGAVYVM